MVMIFALGVLVGMVFPVGMLVFFSWILGSLKETD